MLVCIHHHHTRLMKSGIHRFPDYAQWTEMDDDSNSSPAVVNVFFGQSQPHPRTCVSRGVNFDERAANNLIDQDCASGTGRKLACSCGSVGVRDPGHF
jgi:hypothetical protein